MNALEKIDRHIKENVSSGNLSKEEAVLVRVKEEDLQKFIDVGCV